VRNAMLNWFYELFESISDCVRVIKFVYRIENPSTGYVEPFTYRIDNMSQPEGLQSAKNNIPGSGDAAECRDCSGIVTDGKQENRIDPSSSVGCTRCGHTVAKTQTIQGTQFYSWGLQRRYDIPITVSLMFNNFNNF